MAKLDFKLPSANDLFSTQEEREELKNKKIIRDIPLSEIDGFPDHPFSVCDDEDMVQLVESIREHGVKMAALVRQKKDGRYELISGHRRKRACEILEISTLKCEVLELSDDEAVIAMVESNLMCRSRIKPSNKAFAYKMQIQALNNQGKRNDLTLSPMETKLRSDSVLSERVGESRAQIQRYIRLTELIPEFLQMVDDEQFPFRSAVEISYLKKNEQEILLDIIENGFSVPSLDKASELKNRSKSEELTEELIKEIMRSEKSKKTSVKNRNIFYTDKLKDVIPPKATFEETEDYIYKACLFYKENAIEKI